MSEARNLLPERKRRPQPLGADVAYTADQIQVLEGREHVRRRPSMYIGSTTTTGLHHLVYEVVDNAVDEALAGYATKIMVTLSADGSVQVEDNGRGIPVDMHKKEGLSALELVLALRIGSAATTALNRRCCRAASPTLHRRRSGGLAPQIPAR